MAESKEISKKRKRSSLPTTHSLMGILTRSKSQIYLHRNRSGQSRPDSTRGRNHQDLQPVARKRKNGSPDEDSSVGCDLSSVSIKDLRLRRVFSPSSTDGVIRNCLDDAENLRKSEVAGNCLGGSKEARENGDFQKLDLSNEDFVQSTPPDAENFGGNQGVERNGSYFSGQFLEKKPSESLQKHDGCTRKCVHEERNGINDSIKSVLKPCSRVKLFKTPGSFSYRRLLPYLMDMGKDYSRSPTTGRCQKTEKGLEEKQFLASNCQETLADKSQTNGCSMEDHNSGSSKELNTKLVESLTSLDNECSSTPFDNGEIQKLELQVSFEDQNLNCSKHDLTSTIDDSPLNKEKLIGVVSSDKMMVDDGEVTKTNVESPCDAQSLDALDQTLSTVSNKCESYDYDEVRQNSNDDTKQFEVEGMSKATICHSFEAQHLNSVNPLSEVGGNRNCSLQQRVDNDGEVLEQVEDLNGECMLMTPPDSDMSFKHETDDSRWNRLDCVSQGMNHVIEKSANETLHRNSSQGRDKSLDSSPKNKMVPNPRLHLKLSKIPGSFSYRRLLPFLIDMRNDFSCASGNDQSLKVEKSSKEKAHSPLFTSGKEICMETFNGKSCSEEHYAGDDSMLLVAAATTPRCSSNQKLTQSPPKQVADSSMITDTQQEHGLLVNHAALDTNQKLETSPQNVVEPLSCLNNFGLFPRDEGAKSVSHQLPLETEEDCVKSTVKCATNKMQSEAIVEASIPPVIPAAGFRKGILKRNPHGCRGLCTCLNCSSFRLHAERSYEFSRNQMQDAEEVALDLIKELSNLRNMLEKSAKDQTSICINQVKEACKEASEAEELARTRLCEMNNDLNIHCRIPCGHRPSVRFANFVEEQVIPIAGSSKK
ncbi:hypothetical protein QUC31_016925 [Theobroma cacao]